MRNNFLPNLPDRDVKVVVMSTISDELVNNVYSHLATFFSRYYDGGDFIIAAVRNYPFYLHGQNPACFSGFLCSQI